MLVDACLLVHDHHNTVRICVDLFPGLPCIWFVLMKTGKAWENK